MYFGRPWEAPGSPKTLPKTMQKIIRKNSGKIGTRDTQAMRDFSAGGGGFPIRSLREAGQEQGNRPQAYRDRETGPRATGNQYKNPMTTPLRARGTVADILDGFWIQNGANRDAIGTLAS